MGYILDFWIHSPYGIRFGFSGGGRVAGGASQAGKEMPKILEAHSFNRFASVSSDE
jgi:hypothetical protein